MPLAQCNVCLREVAKPASTANMRALHVNDRFLHLADGSMPVADHLAAVDLRYCAVGLEGGAGRL